MSEKKRILIVDDEKDTLEILTEALECEQLDILTAENGNEALGALLQYKPHLVITDHNMPDMTGFEMLKELRAKENYVSVIFVSARTDANFVAEALREGADDYIRKPFKINELQARVETCLRTNEIHAKLFAANQKLQEKVDEDYLTGLFNMRSMFQKIEYEIKRAKRFERSISCVMMDMDNFKGVNDGHDHLFGSFVLQKVGELIKQTMREIDFAARYGGDEYLIVLIEAGEKGTATFCERLRKKIEENLFKSGEDEMHLTSSIGFSVFHHTDEIDAKQLVRQADNALYQAKETGRNRVKQYDPEGSKKPE